MSYLGAAGQGLLIAVFVVSVAGKTRHRTDFHDYVASLRRTGLIAPSKVRVVALVTVMAEVLAGLFLLLPSTRRVGFMLAGLLLAVLTTGIAVIVRRGTSVTCRCFGASNVALQLRHIIRNGILTGVAVVGVFAGAESLSLAVVVVVLIGAVCAVPVIFLDDLFDLFRPPARQVYR